MLPFLLRVNVHRATVRMAGVVRNFCLCLSWWYEKAVIAEHVTRWVLYFMIWPNRQKEHVVRCVWLCCFLGYIHVSTKCLNTCIFVSPLAPEETVDWENTVAASPCMVPHDDFTVVTRAEMHQLPGVGGTEIRKPSRASKSSSARARPDDLAV